MFFAWPQRSVGMMGRVPEVKQEGDVFLEETETVLASRPLKFLFVNEAPFCTLVYFPQHPFIETEQPNTHAQKKKRKKKTEPELVISEGPSKSWKI